MILGHTFLIFDGMIIAFVVNLILHITDVILEAIEVFDLHSYSSSKPNVLV